ncbi:hypothetical protein LINGRAHAP2_LOCUS4972, partial [Linum grandiflorum]
FYELQRSKWVISHSFDLQTTHRQNLWIRDDEWINLRFNSGMLSLKIGCLVVSCCTEQEQSGADSERGDVDLEF